MTTAWADNGMFMIKLNSRTLPPAALLKKRGQVQAKQRCFYFMSSVDRLLCFVSFTGTGFSSQVKFQPFYSHSNLVLNLLLFETLNETDVIFYPFLTKANHCETTRGIIPLTLLITDVRI